MVDVWPPRRAAERVATHQCGRPKSATGGDLSAAGVPHIEVGQFLCRRKWVPPNAGSARGILAGIQAAPPMPAYSALTPNLKGFEAALAARSGVK